MIIRECSTIKSDWNCCTFSVVKVLKVHFEVVNMGLFKVAILTLLVAASRQECGLKKYRSIDGTCNNLVYITWGESYTVYERLIPPIYSDGKLKKGPKCNAFNSIFRKK